VILRGALESESQTLIILIMLQFINFMSFYFILKFDIGLGIMAKKKKLNAKFQKAKHSPLWAFFFLKCLFMDFDV